MRIVLLTPCFWPAVRRGTERHVHDLAEGLRELGHEPIVVTTGRGRVDGLRVVRLPRLPEGRYRLPPLRGHLPFVAPALRALRPDVTHAFHAGDAAAAAASRSRGALVYTHTGIPSAADLATQGPDGMRAATECDEFVVLSRHAADAAVETTGRRPAVIAPGVRLERFPCGTRRTPAPTLVYAGSDDPRKRLGLLLAAWEIVRRRHAGARLVVDRRTGAAGDGVELADFDDTDRLAAVTGEAWAAVLPSVSEAFGLVLVEALATGTPVVATRAGGMPEVVDRPGIGRLFEGGADALAGALEETLELARRPETRSLCRARAEELDARATADAHAALYSRLASRTARTSTQSVNAQSA